MRLRDIGDARIQLGPVDEAALGLSDAATVARGGGTKSRRTTFAVVTGLVLVIAAGTWWYRQLGIDATPNAWSPDSRAVAYGVPRADPVPREWALAIREIDGPERILRPWTRGSVLIPTSWTPDGRFIVGTLTAGPAGPAPKLVSWPAAATAAGSERHSARAA